MTTHLTKKKLIKTIEHDNTTREYILYVLESYYSKSKVPLVLNFHGYGGTAENYMNTVDMRSLADSNGTILIYPQGLELNNKVQSKDEDYSTHWNTGLLEKKETKVSRMIWVILIH